MTAPPSLPELQRKWLARLPVPAHICLFNVFITATQRLPGPATEAFLTHVVQPVLAALQQQQGTGDRSVAAAGMQLLFVAVHHLKAPWGALAQPLAALAVGTLSAAGGTSGPDVLAACKLLAALLASDEEVVEQVVGQVVEAREGLVQLERSTRAVPGSELHAVSGTLLRCLVG